MAMNSSAFIAAIAYHAVLAAIGFGFAWLGCRLLAVRVERPADEVPQANGRLLTVLRQVHPGCWFALFGGLAVGICLLRAIFIDFDRIVSGGAGSAAAPVPGAFGGLMGFGVWRTGLLLATFLLALMTGWYAWSNQRYVQAVQKQIQFESDPLVVVFTRRDPAQTAGLQIVVRNCGKGFAKDVRFERSARVDEDTWHEFLNGAGVGSPPLMNTLVGRGIELLSPGEELPVAWDPRGFALMWPLFPIVCRFKRLGPEPQAELGPVECHLALSMATAGAGKSM
jgi:hypothetical protein